MGMSISIPEISSVINVTPQGIGKMLKALPKETVDSEIKGRSRFITSLSMRALMESRGYQYPKKNIIFHCLKGGASKTTLAYNSAFRLAQLGAKVLLIDLDKQANTSRTFKVDRPDLVFVDLVGEKNSIEDAIIPIYDCLHLLPSSLKNARLETELINVKANPKTYYEKLLSPVRDNYDIIIMDLPPDLNFNSYHATLFATTICIPTNPDEYSVDGMRMTLETVQNIQNEYPELHQETLIIWSKYDARERNSLHYITELKDIGEAVIMPVVIRSDTTFKNAQAENKAVFQMPKKSNAKEDIDILAQELLGVRDFFCDPGQKVLQ